MSRDIMIALCSLLSLDPFCSLRLIPLAYYWHLDRFWSLCTSSNLPVTLLKMRRTISEQKSTRWHPAFVDRPSKPSQVRCRSFLPRCFYSLSFMTKVDLPQVLPPARDLLYSMQSLFPAVCILAVTIKGVDGTIVDSLLLKRSTILRDGFFFILLKPASLYFWELEFSPGGWDLYSWAYTESTSLF